MAQTIESEEVQNHQPMLNMINKGTGAGGSKTNKNGLPYEELSDLRTEYKIISKEKHFTKIQFNLSDKKYLSTKKSNFFKCMKGKIDTNITKAHGCKEPDECYIYEEDNENKIIFIIEKKFQQGSGSVCEKIQSPDFKIWQYSRTFPEYQIVYIYCLSDWFKENCKAELEYLEQKNIPVFWGNDKEYKSQITYFISNYK